MTSQVAIELPVFLNSQLRTITTIIRIVYIKWTIQFMVDDMRITKILFCHVVSQKVVLEFQKGPRPKVLVPCHAKTEIKLSRPLQALVDLTEWPLQNLSTCPSNI